MLQAERRLEPQQTESRRISEQPKEALMIRRRFQIGGLEKRGRTYRLRYRVDINSLAHQPVSQLQLNEIGVVSVETQRPLFFDPYRKNRATGSFILIDPITNETLGAGMIEQAVTDTSPRGRVTAAERAAVRGSSGR